MRMVQSAIGLVLVIGIGLMIFGGYDANGAMEVLVSWSEMGMRLVLTLMMLGFFLSGLWLAHDSLKEGKPKDAAVLVVLSIIIMFGMPMAARMGTVNAAKELNRTLVESEPQIDVAAQNVVRIIRQSEGALVVPATATPVPTSSAPLITDLTAPLPTAQPTAVSATATPEATANAVEDVPFDISTWNPQTPPPTPGVGR